jgi:hypothetical protein
MVTLIDTIITWFYVVSHVHCTNILYYYYIIYTL